MALRLTRRQQTRKSNLMAAAWQQHTVLCERIDAFNARLVAERHAVQAAEARYRAALAELGRFAEEVAADGHVALAQRSARWREGHGGQAARDWVNAYQAFKPALPAIRLPEDLDHPDDDALGEFEELGDHP